MTTIDKNNLIDRVAKAFCKKGMHMDSKAFLALLEDQLDEQTLSQIQLIANPIDDKYGILTIQCILPGDPTPLEFRLKKDNAYGGPKTEHYIDRIKLKRDACLELMRKQNSTQYMFYKKRLDDLFKQYENLLLKNCKLDHEKIKEMRPENHTGTAHFYKQHDKAKMILGCYMEDLCAMMQDALGFEDANKAKAALYSVEQSTMSRKRPERITVRKLHTHVDADELIEINTTTPVDKARTVSSAKKDEAGVANWLLSTTRVCAISKQGELKTAYARETYRSASIVPHDLFKKDSLSTQLANETAKRNLLEHIIPALVMAQQNDLEPIQINYEMLTLLSPISRLADKAFDPDYAQFKAIKAAFNQFQGRKLNIPMPDGSTKLVQFNGIYHNYGVNAARGFHSEEKANIRAFNQILLRSRDNLKDFKAFQTFFAQMPMDSPRTDRAVQSQHNFLEHIYKRIDKNNEKMTPYQHERLLKLHGQFLNKQLSGKQQEEYQHLVNLFKEIQALNAPLTKEVRAIESRLLKYEKQLATERKAFFKRHRPHLEAALQQLEHSSELSPQQQAQTQHMRALLEYVKLVTEGYDKYTLIKKYTSKDIEAMNRVNYEIQSYIGILSKHCNYALHLTCKSGKDRTNSSMEKQKAKDLITFLSGHVPSQQDSFSRQREQILFDDGLLRGPGNDICGDNMKPAAQQLEHAALPSRINVDILRDMSILQKGIDKLKVSQKKRQAVQAALGMAPKAKTESRKFFQTGQFDKLRTQPKKVYVALKAKLPRIK